MYNPRTDVPGLVFQLDRPQSPHHHGPLHPQQPHHPLYRHPKGPARCKRDRAVSASATPDQFDKPSSPPPALPQPALSRLQLPPKPSPTPPAAIVGPHLPRQAGPAGPWPPTSSFSAGQPLPPPPFTLASPRPPPSAPAAPPHLLPNRTAKAQHPSLLQPADLPQKQPSDIFSDVSGQMKSTSAI